MTPNSIVVDASVAIKWVVPEPDSDLADVLFERYRLIAPQLIYAECANILWKKLRRSEITTGELAKATLVIDELPVSTVSMRELVPLAVDLAVRLDHAAYDCFYIALSTLQACPLVTADEKLHRKVKAALPPLESARCLLLADLTRQ